MLKTRIAAVAAAAVLSTTFASAADAALTVNIRQDGNFVVGEYYGTLDTNGLSAIGSFALALGVRGDAAYVGIGEVENQSVIGYEGFTGPSSFGAGTDVFAPFAQGGNHFALNGSFFNGPTVFLEDGYVSGSLIGGYMVYTGATIASLGLNTGTYTFQSAFDTITVNISAVPEPTTWAMMILGMGAVGGAMRRRRAVSTTVRFA